MTKLRRIGLVMSVVGATALVSAPAAFAEHGHGGRDRDRGAQVAEDRHEDDEEVFVVPGQPRQVLEVEDEPELNDINDDDD